MNERKEVERWLREAWKGCSAVIKADKYPVQ
jgi:hypothetical protein